MGKKHKKHKSEKKSIELEVPVPVPIPESIPPEKIEKPLRLVLKVGTQQQETIQEIYTHEEKKHKHHKKKKKKKDKDKDKHRHDESSSRKSRPPVEIEDVQPEPPPAKKQAIVSPVEEPMETGESEQRQREPRTCTIREEDETAILRQCLHYLQINLQKKDVNGFFAFPVTDAIAPGYSSIIQNPVDFSTLLAKIEADEYRNVIEYKKDFITMCNNAMTYNRPETIYYKEAKKLLHSGLKMTSKDKLLHMKKSMSFMANITLQELGLDENGAAAEAVAVIDEEEQRMKEYNKKQKQKNSLGRFEAVPDNLTADEILAQARAAARDVKEELTLRQQTSNFGFLRKRKDGSTSLTILNPDNDGKVSETERIVMLGELTGKLTSGTGSLAGFKEDKRNKVSPVSYLNYGPFSSYAPQYDSSFANVTKEDSDLLLSTYGDETGVQYAKSVMNFVANANDEAVKIVDNLLDILTKGQHSRTNRLLEQKKKQEEERKAQEKKKKENEEKSENIDFNSVRSLSDLGVDVSFVDYFEKEMGNDKLQQRLDQTAGLIQDLQQTQRERLSMRPPSHLSLVPGPSEKETELAEKVSKELRALAKEAAPREISSIKGIRAAMGISMHKVPSLGGQKTIGSSEHSITIEDNENAGFQAPTHFSHDENTGTEVDNDLQEFLQQGPMLKVSESPTRELESDTDPRQKRKRTEPHLLTGHAPSSACMA